MTQTEVTEIPIHIKTLLAELENVRAALHVVQMDMDKKRAEIMAPVASDLRDLEAEYSPMIESAQEKLALVEQAVRNEVVTLGVSVRGEFIHAVYVSGRVSWNTAALDGYLKAYPELAEFRKEGAPSVTIRNVR